MSRLATSLAVVKGAATTDIDARIGARIRELRAARNLTLEELAARADVSRAMLSRIERGESSPTAQLLGKVCGGLGVTLSVLFAAAERLPSPLARRQQQPTWRDPATGYRRRHVSPPATGSPVDIVEIEFPAGASVTFDYQRLKGAEQHIWVLEGALEVTLGDEVFRLEQGDCLKMEYGRPIQYRNRTRRLVRYAVVVSHDSGPP
jgi:transcriptional regulator with XRE-family HTH domain